MRMRAAKRFRRGNRRPLCLEGLEDRRLLSLTSALGGAGAPLLVPTSNSVTTRTIFNTPSATELVTVTTQSFTMPAAIQSVSTPVARGLAENASPVARAVAAGFDSVPVVTPAVNVLEVSVTVEVVPTASVSATLDTGNVAAPAQVQASLGTQPPASSGQGTGVTLALGSGATQSGVGVTLVPVQAPAPGTPTLLPPAALNEVAQALQTTTRAADVTTPAPVNTPAPLLVGRDAFVLPTSGTAEGALPESVANPAASVLALTALPTTMPFGFIDSGIGTAILEQLQLLPAVAQAAPATPDAAAPQNGGGDEAPAQDTLLPLESGLNTQPPAQDSGAVERGLQQLVATIDQAGQGLTSFLTRYWWSPYLIATAAAALGLEIYRRWQKVSHRRLLFAGTGRRMLPTWWFPGAGDTTVEEAE